jgi:hypothetical protein
MTLEEKLAYLEDRWPYVCEGTWKAMDGKTYVTVVYDPTGEDEAFSVEANSQEEACDKLIAS